MVPVPQIEEKKPLTLTEEHVPDTQHRGPGQSPREGTHEPLGHVHDGLQVVLLEVAVGHGGHLMQQSIQDLPVQLNGLLWRRQVGAVRTTPTSPKLISSS